MNLPAAVDRYFEYLRVERGASAHTLRNYRIDLDQFAAFLQQSAVRPHKVTHLEIRRWLTALHENGLAASSAQRKLATLRSFYRFLGREGLASKNPASLVCSPRVSRHLPVVPTADEVCKALDGISTAEEAFPARDSAILEVLYGCGLRVSEAAGLNLADIERADEVVRVRGKGRKERYVPLGSKAHAALDRYLRARDSLTELAGRERPTVADGEALFLNCFGTRITTRSTAVRL